MSGLQAVIYARKVDLIQPACVAAWKAAGKVWLPTFRQGGGVDGFLLHRGVWLAVEFKTGNSKLRGHVQKGLHQEVGAKGGTIHIIRSVDEALAFIGAR